MKARNVQTARARLLDEFPHLPEGINVLLSGIVDGKPIALRPTLLLGEPGGGTRRPSSPI
jgi:hypothetical protein